jgi:hypothetical protein
MWIAGWRGAFCGVIAGACTFFSFLDDDRKAHIIKNEILGDVILFGYDTLVCVLYLILWLAPNRGVLKRRPAIIYWASFWAPERLIFCVAELLEEFRVDAG